MAGSLELSRMQLNTIHMYLPTPTNPPPLSLHVEYVHVPTHVRTYCPHTHRSLPLFISHQSIPATSLRSSSSPSSSSSYSSPPPPTPPSNTASTCLVLFYFVLSCLVLHCLALYCPLVTPSRPLGHPPSPGPTKLTAHYRYPSSIFKLALLPTLVHSLT